MSEWALRWVLVQLRFGSLAVNDFKSNLTSFSAEQKQLLASGNKLLQLQFEDEEKADFWLKEFLETRICFFSLLYDLCPSLRALSIIATNKTNGVYWFLLFFFFF
jgi:hypothetical protein